MESSASHADQRPGATTGRVAVPEIAELLHLQRPAAAVAAGVVVILGLVVALVAPGALPANAFTGLAVGLVALLAAVAAAVVLDGRDPVLRGPRHLRRDGHTVLARMAGPDPVEHGAVVLEALERRLAERDHVSVAVTGTGTDPSALAVALGRGAAAAGRTSLVIDLRAPGAPGVADVGQGTVRLGEAAQLADDRPYAWIGAGTDRGAALTAAAGVARRPPRDLELLLIVAPEAATHAPELLQACERTVLLVAADTQQRAMVSARLEALQRAGGRPEAVVVGGLHVGAAEIGQFGADEVAPEPAPGGEGPFAQTATPIEDLDPFSPATESPATKSPATEPAAEQPGPPAATPPAPIPPAPTTTSSASPAPPAPPSAPAEEATPAPPPEALDVFADDAGFAAPYTADSRPETAADPSEDQGPQGPTVDEEGQQGTPSPSLDDTGPIPPVTFRTAGAVEADDFASSDPLVTTAALEQLLHRHGDQD